MHFHYLSLFIEYTQHTGNSRKYDAACDVERPTKLPEELKPWGYYVNELTFIVIAPDR
jgi:hypothetical protein